jgi:hypothetical protein
MSENKTREGRTFFVDTRFQRLARRPGGIPRETAIENAQEKIEENKPDLVAWVDDEITELIKLMAQVEAGTAEPHWVDAIASHCRQLRDIGGTIGYPLLTFIASNLCEILDSASTEEVTLEMIACHVDALRLARQARYRNMRPDQLPELTGGLRRVAEFVRISPDDVRIAPEDGTK